MLLQILSVRPEGEVTLKEGGGRCVVELLFSPEQRMPPFTEELQLECLGAVRPLLVMKGCCQGVEVRLDTYYLQFGAVVQRCQATRRIIMQNTGDIGARYTLQFSDWLHLKCVAGSVNEWILSDNAITYKNDIVVFWHLQLFLVLFRFKWDVKSFAPDFIIFPAEGYITPGMEVSLEVTFAPTELIQDLRYDDLCCTIEGGKPLKLTLTGSCIVPPVATEVSCSKDRRKHKSELGVSKLIVSTVHRDADEDDSVSVQ